MPTPASLEQQHTLATGRRPL